MVKETKEWVNLIELLEFGFELKPNVNDKFRNSFLRDKPIVTVLKIMLYDRNVESKVHRSDGALIRLDNGSEFEAYIGSLEKEVRKKTRIYLK